MNRKIIGIFVIALVTISYMPMVSSEASQVPESYESKGGDIKIFFIGRVYGYGGTYSIVKAFLAHFGIYVEIIWQNIDVIGNNFFLVDGKIKHLEPPCTLILHNFSGIGTPFGFLMFILKFIIPPDYASVFFAGSCESYEIENETVMAT